MRQSTLSYWSVTSRAGRVQGMLTLRDRLNDPQSCLMMAVVVVVAAAAAVVVLYVCRRASVYRYVSSYGRKGMAPSP